MKLLTQLALLFGSIAVAQAQGTFEGLTDFTTSAASGVVAGTAGWSFTPQISIEVTFLGCLDYVVTPQGPVDVGIWTDAGQLVASAQVAPTNTLFNVSRYATISPIFLNGGSTYRIGAYSPSGSLFLDPVGDSFGGSSTVSSDLNLVGLATGTGGFVFPSSQGILGSMLLGPNFLYARVPEPTTAALLILGGILFAVGKRRNSVH